MADFHIDERREPVWSKWSPQLHDRASVYSMSSIVASEHAAQRTDDFKVLTGSLSRFP